MKTEPTLRVALVGHCGPDMSYLMLAVNSAAKVSIDRINDQAALQKFLSNDSGVMLVNRVLDGDFTDDDGLALIARARALNPQIKAMLISNFDDAQAGAMKAGALPGFGKRDIGSAKAKQLLRDAFEPRMNTDKHR